MSTPNLQAGTLTALMAPSAAEKSRCVRALLDGLRDGSIACTHPDRIETVPVPGRPDRPRLVAPSGLEKRGLGSVRGRACLIHAVAHIEFNAINLALDAVYRFPGMPRDYYLDWLAVAADEGRHFVLLSGRLAQLGFAYGAFPAHNGLWEMALKTAGCGMTRMALVPRVLEARGLDVSPGMIARLESVGDSQTAGILRLILREEEGHVEIGTRWFRYWCARLGESDPDAVFLDLVSQGPGAVKPPLNRDARSRAGFSRTELAGLESLI